ncbi:hypothetical protein AAK894_06600 [Lachnospiraceae bacterium 46-61]
MNDKIKQTFDKIYAEDELKIQTKQLIVYQTINYYTRKNVIRRRIVSVMACFLFFIMGFGGYHLYFTQMSMISIDINPSIELNINRFDKVISINSYNDDGMKLANVLDIKFMNYKNAIDEILNTDIITENFVKNETLSIVVVGKDEQKSKEMYENIQNNMSENQNVCCDMANFNEVNEAHEVGLSVGKYRAYMELQNINENITIDDIKGLTMSQIRECINQEQYDEQNANCENEQQKHSGGNGNQHRHRYKHGVN